MVSDVGAAAFIHLLEAMFANSPANDAFLRGPFSSVVLFQSDGLMDVLPGFCGGCCSAREALAANVVSRRENVV